MMDPETEAKIKAELEQIVGGYVFWKMRETAGEYANKIRIDVFFPRNDGANAHYIETEAHYSAAKLKEAEVYFLEYEKKRMVEDAKQILTGKDIQQL